MGDPNPCDENAYCINHPGTYQCICKEAYFGEGETCTAICNDHVCPGVKKCFISSNDTAQCSCTCSGTEVSLSVPVICRSINIITYLIDFPPSDWLITRAVKSHIGWVAM